MGRIRKWSAGDHGGVGRISVLQNMEKSDEAERLLKEIHSRVEPLMKEHKWYLPELCEFFPTNECLLGVNWNAGDKICIRLRPSYDKNSFLDMDDSLIPTMLHELTHNHRGPHDDEFFRFLEKLTDEYHDLRRKRYIAYAGNGQRLGSTGLRNGSINIREARVKRQQELERQKQVLGRGGRLGGSGPARPSPATIAKAAERRMRATKGCGGDDSHGHPGGADRAHQPPEIVAEVERAARESIFIDLTTDSDNSDVEVLPSDPKKAKSSGSSSSASPAPAARSSSSTASTSTLASVSTREKRGATRLRTTRDRNNDDEDSSASDLEIVSEKPATKVPIKGRLRPRPSPQARRSNASSSASKLRSTVSTPPKGGSRRPKSAAAAAAALPPSPKDWVCSKCTLMNDATTTQCEACSATLAPIRPLKASMALFAGDGWNCNQCLTINEHTYWSCSFCGVIKTSSARG
ncbi:hypothetical protein JCM10908_001047 [Rhodotorula pacifica]|uniref:uncharacterized protein n=1 Tax=Rhodotorula pacifica TaxID=1495444 RepID=UPI0031823C4C